MTPAVPNSTTPEGEGGAHPSPAISSTLDNVDILIKPTPSADEKERANMINAATTAATKPTSSDDDSDDIEKDEQEAAAAVAAMEGGNVNYVGVSFATNTAAPAPINTTAANTPGGARPRLMSPVSAVYDRTGKGYLDSTELALRKMDSQNLGYVDMNKVFGIMESLQEEQKKSSLLIESLHKEQRRAMSLRKALTGIVIFAVLLACSNVGTSFAAARLAKDTIIYPTSNDLINQANGERIATTNKMIDIKINPITSLDGLPERRRRHLEEATSLACGRERMNGNGNNGSGNGNNGSGNGNNGSDNGNGNNGNGNGGVTVCKLAGQIAYEDAVHLYQQFCPNWPWPDGTFDCCAYFVGRPNPPPGTMMFVVFYLPHVASVCSSSRSVL